ncbi:ATP-binding protein [Gemmobacter lanyuensis]
MQLTLPDIPADLRVMGEGVRLEQVLVNLLQNAHEAVADQPQAEIRVSLATDATTATLTIADNGPGLPTEVAAALFTPFQTTKPGGLGLGLVIAHDIARDFGARLWADPRGRAGCDLPSSALQGPGMIDTPAPARSGAAGR